jgi:hypothetical protein
MAKKEQESFKVSDRRLFTPEGELRREAEEQESSAPVPQAPASTQPAPSNEGLPPSIATPETQSTSGETPVPPAPSASEQQAQADAYRASARDLDTRVELSGHSAKELEMTFERFMASLYISAMLQLGLMHEQGGQPRVDLFGARQTIDTLSLLAEKTKGNLTPTEANFLQNCLYELRMAYVEVTNALARPPEAAEAPGANKTR